MTFAAEFTAPRSEDQPNRWPLVTMLLASVIAAVLAGALSWQSGMRRLDAALADRHSITAHMLSAEIERLRHLPLVLAEDPRLAAAIEPAPSPSAITAANDYLKRIRNATAAEEAYLIGADGITRAASNWDEEGSFLGMSYGFRPYFLDAVTEGQGKYYAVGVTTGRPGLFLSARLPAEGPAKGVAVVKVALSQMEIAWSRAGEISAVADPDGVIFLSSAPHWRFRPLSPLSQDAAQDIATEQRYSGLDIDAAAPLPIQGARLTADERAPLRLREGPVPGTDWRLLVALPTSDVRLYAGLIAVIAATAGFLLSAFSVALWQRRQISNLRMAQTQQLEARVEERTRALAQEVEERTRAQDELRRTHESLVHAAKLAVLGRMSSAIVHEVGQSLSALDNSLAAAALHGQSGAAARLETALSRARGMVGRMQGVVTRLRNFGGRQTPATLRRTALAPVLATASEIVTPRAKELGCRITLPDTPLPDILADAPRLEQVMTNLLLNGVEATARNDAPRHVEARVTQQGRRVAISIHDSGPGIPEGLRATLTDPFVTSHQGGLGLGLYIVQSLLEQMQGKLEFSEGAGAVATVWLDGMETDP